MLHRKASHTLVCSSLRRTPGLLGGLLSAFIFGHVSCICSLPLLRPSAGNVSRCGRSASPLLISDTIWSSVLVITGRLGEQWGHKGHHGNSTMHAMLSRPRGVQKDGGGATLTVLAPAAGLQSLGSGAPFASGNLSSFARFLRPLAHPGAMPG